MEGIETETGKSVPVKQLIVFLRGHAVHTYWKEKDLQDVIIKLGQGIERRYAGLFHMLDGKGTKVWLDLNQVDGWMVKDIEPNVAQVIVAAIEQQQKEPPILPGDEWKHK